MSLSVLINGRKHLGNLSFADLEVYSLLVKLLPYDVTKSESQPTEWPPARTGKGKMIGQFAS